MLLEAKNLLSTANIYLPSKVVVGSNINSTESRVCDVNSVQDHEMILDQVVDDQVLALISQAKQIIWNGPIGVFEKNAFAHGTQQLAEAIAKSSAFSLAGGEKPYLQLKCSLIKMIFHIAQLGAALSLNLWKEKSYHHYQH